MNDVYALVNDGNENHEFKVASICLFINWPIESKNYQIKTVRGEFCS